MCSVGLCRRTSPRSCAGAAEVADHGLQVADSHVVGRHGEVLAAEAPAGEREVAARWPPATCAGRSAHPRAPCGLAAARAPLVARALGPGDAAREPARGARVDLHAQQVVAGLRQDLGEADGALELGVRHGAGPPRRLQEHDRLEQVRRHAGGRRRALDLGAEGRRPARALHHAARALRVERVGVAGGGAALEVGAAGLGVGERVRASAGIRATGSGSGRPVSRASTRRATATAIAAPASAAAWCARGGAPRVVCRYRRAARPRPLVLRGAEHR